MNHKQMHAKLMLSTLMCLFVLMHVPVTDCTSYTPPPIVYVSGTGNGDFNCGSTNADVQINQALQFVANNPGYTTVYLRGPFTYTISKSLLIGSNTILTGDSTATVKLTNNAGWSVTTPLITATSSTHDITICGFKVDGNAGGNTNVNNGADYENIMWFKNVNDITVHDMFLTNNHDDAMELHSCTNIAYYNNIIYLIGHDGLYACNSLNVDAYNNNITCQTNSGLRAYDTDNVKYHDNVITSLGGGGAGIEIQKYGSDLPMRNIEVYNNIIHNTVYAGIWVFGASTYSPTDAYVHIHDNTVYDTGGKTSVIGGILSDGFDGLIENNNITGTYGAGIAQANIYTDSPKGSGFVLTVNNNTITNTRAGYGINNALPSTHSFVIGNNTMSNNLPGDCYTQTAPVPPTLKTPVAAFSASSTSVKASTSITFTDKSTGIVTSRTWNFGDSGSSTAQNPAHKYTKTGKYTVALTVKNSAGSNTKTQQNYITVK
jgi:PKD repeat protein